MAVSPLNNLVAGTSNLLRMGQTATTLLLSDIHITRPGSPLFTSHPVLDAVVPTAHRTLIFQLTAPLMLHELLRTVLKGLPPDDPRSIQIIGDVSNTSYRSEIETLEVVLNKNKLEANNYSKGNHEGKNFSGVLYLLSRVYCILRELLGSGVDLEEEIRKTAGSEENVLTQTGTYELMQRLMHLQTGNAPGIEAVDTSVGLASEVKNDDLKGFWKQTRPGHWEALVNADIADLPVFRWRSEVTPFFIQASLQTQIPLDDGSVAPIYTISLDSQATRSFFSGRGAIPEFQLRLAQAFIEEARRENPQARFEITSHFPTSRLLEDYSNPADRAALKEFLSQESIDGFISGHTHERAVQNLTEALGLNRTTPLRETTLPSLADYSPFRDPVSGRDKDGLALGIERKWMERGANGQLDLKISMEFKGLNREDFKEGLTPEVEAALAKYRDDHGYVQAKKTFRDLKTKYLKGFLKRQVRRTWDFLSVGLNPFRGRKFINYWKTASLPGNIFDNAKTISFIHMFNEVEDLVPLLDGVLHFLNKERWGELPVTGLIQGARNCIADEYAKSRPAFDAAFERGDNASMLVQYASIFEKIKLPDLQRALIDLPEGSAAQVFAIRAGTGAARDEALFEGRKPTKIPNKVEPPISIPLGRLDLTSSIS